MSRSGWRYLAQRLDGQGTSAEFLDTSLPLTDVSFTDVLSGPSDLSASVSPEVARLLGPDGRPLFAKWQTAIYAEHEGEIRNGGIVTGLERNGPALSLTCTGFSSYPDGQPWTDPAGYKGIRVDPLDVARVIWDHLQGEPDGNLGVTLDRATMSGKKIGREYRVVELDPQDDPNVGPSTFESGPVLLRWYETQDLGEVFAKLAQETPFDYHERHKWVGDEIHHFLDFGYPRIGRKRDDLRYVVGENIMPLPAVSSDEYATFVMGLGAGEGRRMLMSTKSRRGTLRRATVVTDKAAKNLRRLNALVDRELAWRTGQDDISQVIVRDHPHAPLGDVSVGDEVFLQGPMPWGSIESWARVVSINVQPSQGETMTMTVIRSDKAF